MANAASENFVLPALGSSFGGVHRTTRVMKKAGWKTVACSNGAAKVAPASDATDSWGNNADPLLDAYPAFNTALAWIVMEGPSNLKIPITADTIGTFIRNEAVTQAGTGATGEINGVVFSYETNTGWAVVFPRTGTFNGSGVITGGTSGATLTPSATPRIFKREIMFSKANNVTDGSYYYVCYDSVSEATMAFSYLATQAGCTATVAPGQGGTNNAFQSVGYVARGTGGAVTHATWVATSNLPGGTANLVCANAVPSAGVSADGSFWCALSSSTAGLLFLFGLCRVDDSEPGDVDPYVTTAPCAQTADTFSRTVVTGYGTGSAGLADGDLYSSSGYTMFRGNAARGCPVTARDVVVPYHLVRPLTQPNGGGLRHPSNVNGSTVVRMLNTPATTPPGVRKHVELWSRAGVASHRKGVLRWLIETPTGAVFDTLDNKKWLVVTARDALGVPGLAIGPMDGVTSIAQLWPTEDLLTTRAVQTSADHPCRTICRSCFRRSISRPRSSCARSDSPTRQARAQRSKPAPAPSDRRTTTAATPSILRRQFQAHARHGVRMDRSRLQACR